MPVTAVLGTQWGDEGKGKIVDVLAERCDHVVRFQGGNNAGHTIIVDDQVFKLHLLPSGVVRGRSGVIGNGCVVDPFVLVDEVRGLQERGIELQLSLSDRAHLILPYHRILDGLQEQDRGDAKVGTTGRGIGPCYADKASRTGIVAGDLLRPARLQDRLRRNVEAKNRLFAAHGSSERLDAEAVLADLAEATETLGPFITDTVRLVQDAVRAGEDVLLEGAQGIMLDIDHGSYPFVTSSSVTGSLAGGTGLAPREITDVLGVVKAYTTRVGAGPFPTELPTDEGPGEHMARVGREVGTTTGRPRRCGWLDLVVVNHAVRLAGITSLAVTKLDVLSGLDTLQVCTQYELPDGTRTDRIPSDPDDFAQAVPVYQEFPGWGELDGGQWQDLPTEARSYLQWIRERTGVPVDYVGTGPARSQTVVR